MKVFKVTIFIFLFIGTLTYLNKVFQNKHHYINTIEDFNSLSNETNIDVIFFGSSHAYTVYNPLIINHECNTISFNLGSASLKTATTNLIFKEAIKRTHPKLVILEFCDSGVKISQDTTDKTEKFQLRVLDQIPFYSFAKAKQISKMFNAQEILGTYSNLIRNHSLWYEKEYFDLERRRYIEEDKYFFSSGFLGVKAVIEDEVEKERFKDFKEIKTFENDSGFLLDNENKTLLIEFITTAKAVDIEVLLIASPELRARHRNYRIYTQLADFAEELNISFLNLNDHVLELELNPNDFYDNQHVNIEGSYKVNKFLGNYLNKNYNLPNRSKEEIWKTQDSLYLEYYKKFVDTTSYSFRKKLNNAFTKNIALDSINIDVKNETFAFQLFLDKSKPFQDSINEYALLVKIYPKKGEENKVNSYNKNKGWNFDKMDIPLNTIGDIISFKINSKIDSIEKLELLLYNKEKYEGVVGNKIFIHDIKLNR
ncbi:MAG: hypothetical protein R2781_11435 [Flavobacteriaceae bacterium]